MAAPNAGKTFFGLDVVVQVAVKAAQQGLRVVIVEEEGTGYALQVRLSRALASVGMQGSDLIRVSWNSGRSLLERADLDHLIADCAGCELVMLDSLSALSGGIDENSSADMAAVAEALHELKSTTGSAVLALHHMTKAAWKEGETPRLEHMRGHGALPGRADAVIALVPLESDQDAVNFEVHCVKQRDGSKPKARKMSVAMTGSAAITEIEDHVKAAVVAKASEHSLLNQIENIIPYNCNHQPRGNCISKTKIENIVPGRAEFIRKAVDQLEHARRITLIRHGCYIRNPTHSNPSRTGSDGGGLGLVETRPPFTGDGFTKPHGRTADGVQNWQDQESKEEPDQPLTEQGDD